MPRPRQRGAKTLMGMASISSLVYEVLEKMFFLPLSHLDVIDLDDSWLLPFKDFDSSKGNVSVVIGN